MSLVLFQIVRELLLNIGKHAQAKQARMTLDKDSEPISISVQDDGVGFDTAAIGFASDGIGLFSIRERLRPVGGTLPIESKRGHGTRVILTSPLKSEESAICP